MKKTNDTMTKLHQQVLRWATQTQKALRPIITTTPEHSIAMNGWCIPIVSPALLGANERPEGFGGGSGKWV